MSQVVLVARAGLRCIKRRRRRGDGVASMASRRRRRVDSVSLWRRRGAQNAIAARRHTRRRAKGRRARTSTSSKNQAIDPTRGPAWPSSAGIGVEVACCSSRNSSKASVNTLRLEAARAGTGLFALAAACSMPSPPSRAWTRNRSRERGPTARGGTFATRSKASSSFGYASSRKYARTSRISFLSKKPLACNNWYDTPALSSSRSTARDWAFVLYKTATSPSALTHTSAIHRASSSWSSSSTIDGTNEPSRPSNDRASLLRVVDSTTADAADKIGCAER
mmetsp:Transcript_12258/g.37715  ORF Transcript_12258/g.37715 Transcript_12258/m.37715 type:complete len:279 (-) Transcript_12258:1389-2225(-)